MLFLATHYLTIKQIHVTCVILSISLFVLRGGMQLADIPWRRWTPLRFVPHIVDTVLLGSTILLATFLHQYPFVHGWITAKVMALLAYILLGKQALRLDAPKLRQATAFVAALLSVTYIVGVALTHSASWGLL